ncbi:MAG: hypothetical protein J4G13_14910 [Dehalococcoidia bacterium]|nr:hypothetical protein [Dehalococcoidia bacterium]
MELIKTKARMFALMVTVLAALMGAGLAGSVGLHGPPPVAALDLNGSKSTFYLECPTETVLEGESFEVYLIREPDPAYKHTMFGAWWHTDAGYADESDYVALPGESEYIQWTTEAERQANRQARTVHTIDDDKVEGDEHFWVRFTPTDSVANPNHPSRDAKCSISIRDDDPHVTKIEMVSLPARGDTYGLGETIEFAATFNNPVDVEGYVVMGFWMGGQWRGGLYQRGSGTDTLVFAYTVQPEDLDDDGIKVHDGYIDQDGRRHGFGGSGDIYIHGMPQVQGVDGFPVNKLYKGIPDQPGHKVDGSQVPRAIEKSLVGSPVDGETYRIGEEIVLELTFSAPVRALHTPHASLWFDGTGESQWRGAKYTAGSGTDILRFVYEVQPGDLDNDGFLVGAKDAQGLGEGKIKAADHEIDAIHTYNEWYLGYKVDGQPPTVTDVSVASMPAEGDTYLLDESIEIDVAFSSPVEVSGEPAITLWIDTGDHSKSAHAALYRSGSGTRTLRFGLKVPATINDANGLTIGVREPDGLGLGTITALGTNFKADQSYPEQRDLSGHKVAGRLIVEKAEIAPDPTANELFTTDVVLSHALLEMEEGESATYTVALSSQPSDDVKVYITRTPIDRGPHAPLALPFLSMSFTPENWNVPQEVTIVAEPDDDTDDHLIFLTHTAHGGGYHLECTEMSVVIRDNNDSVRASVDTAK